MGNETGTTQHTWNKENNYLMIVLTDNFTGTICASAMSCNSTLAPFTSSEAASHGLRLANGFMVPQLGHVMTREAAPSAD